MSKDTDLYGNVEPPSGLMGRQPGQSSSGGLGIAPRLPGPMGAAGSATLNQAQQVTPPSVPGQDALVAPGNESINLSEEEEWGDFMG